MPEAGGQSKADIFVQGSVAIAAGVIFFAVLFLPWLYEGTALSGLVHPASQAALIIPMTLIILAIITIFGGAIHMAGFGVGIKLATVTSAVALFISIMAIVVTVVSATLLEEAIKLLIGPWICAAGAIFGAISSTLERRQQKPQETS